MRDYLLKLFAHEQWANRKLLTTLSALPSLPPRTAQLFPHLIGAHEFWFSKIHGAQVNWWDYNFTPEHSLDECLALNDDFAVKWAQFISALPDPLAAQTFAVTLKNGERVDMRYIDIFTQLHGHSIHHRAQIIADMRAAGLEPVPQDWLIFCRETQHP